MPFKNKHGTSTTSLRILFQFLTTFMAQKCFPVPSLTFPWHSIMLCSHPAVGDQEQSLASLSAPPPQGAIESNEVTSGPPLLQSGQLWFPPALLLALVPPLDSFKDFSTLFILWNLELHKKFKAVSHHS